MLIPQMFQIVGQIGLHMLTETVGAAIEGATVNLAKIGDLSLVKVEKLNLVFALVGSPPKISNFLGRQNVTASMGSGAEEAELHNSESLNLASASPASSQTNTSSEGTSVVEKPGSPPFRTGLSVLLDADHRLRPGFRTFLSSSVLFVAESETSNFVAFPSFDYEGVDVRLQIENSRPTRVFHFHKLLEPLALGGQTSVTTNTRLSSEEIISLTQIDDHFPVVIAPLTGFRGRVWHLRQQHPARDMRHYIIVLLPGDRSNGV